MRTLMKGGHMIMQIMITKMDLHTSDATVGASDLFKVC